MKMNHNTDYLFQVMEDCNLPIKSITYLPSGRVTIEHDVPSVTGSQFSSFSGKKAPAEVAYELYWEIIPQIQFEEFGGIKHYPMPNTLFDVCPFNTVEDVVTSICSHLPSDIAVLFDAEHTTFSVVSYSHENDPLDDITVHVKSEGINVEVKVPTFYKDNYKLVAKVIEKAYRIQKLEEKYEESIERIIHVIEQAKVVNDEDNDELELFNPLRFPTAEELPY